MPTKRKMSSTDLEAVNDLQAAHVMTPANQQFAINCWQRIDHINKTYVSHVDKLSIIHEVMEMGLSTLDTESWQWRQRFCKIRMGHPNVDVKYRWGKLKSATFDQYIAIPQKLYKIETRLLRKSNSNSYTPTGVSPRSLASVTRESPWSIIVWPYFCHPMFSHFDKTRLVTDRRTDRRTHDRVVAWRSGSVVGQDQRS